MTRMAALTAVAITALGLTGPAQEAPQAHQDGPAVAEAPVVSWAQQRFADAGLELGQVTIVAHDTIVDCGGRVGYFVPSTDTLHLCRLDEATLLHELAHVWADRNLTNTERQGFVELRGLDSWNDHDDAWKNRATEHAAETITWALMVSDTTVRWVEDNGTVTNKLLTIDDSSPAALTEAYTFLTGLDLPFGRAAATTTTPTLSSPEAQKG